MLAAQDDSSSGSSESISSASSQQEQPKKSKKSSSGDLTEGGGLKRAHSSRRKKKKTSENVLKDVDGSDAAAKAAAALSKKKKPPASKKRGKREESSASGTSSDSDSSEGGMELIQKVKSGLGMDVSHPEDELPQTEQLEVDTLRDKSMWVNAPMKNKTKARRLMNQWQVIGVVAALVSTMAYDSITHAPDLLYSGNSKMLEIPDSVTAETLVQIYITMGGLSLITAGSSVSAALTLYVALNKMADHDINWFLNMAWWMLYVPDTLLQISIALLLTCKMLFVYLVYNGPSHWILIGTGFVFFCAILTTHRIFEYKALKQARKSKKWLANRAVAQTKLRNAAVTLAGASPDALKKPKLDEEDFTEGGF